jgi:RsiW-degrading membrane proteinase PrsW (M82 family)
MITLQGVPTEFAPLVEQTRGADEPKNGPLWGVLAALGFAVIVGVFYAFDRPAPTPRWVHQQRRQPSPW